MTKPNCIRPSADKFGRDRTNEKGFIRVGRWKIYIEEGLPKTPVEVTYWDGKLRAEYRQTKLAEYDCRWDEKGKRPKTIEKPEHFETKYQSKQPELFEVGWQREPIEEIRAERKAKKLRFSKQLQLPFRKKKKKQLRRTRYSSGNLK